MRGALVVSSGCLIFMALITAMNWLAKWIFAGTIASGLRSRATVELTAAMLAELIGFVLLYFYLRRRGETFRDLGLWKSSPFKGWVAAAFTAALFIWFNVALPLRGQPNLGEISVFHFYNAISAGLVAGFVEETFFRGFVMEELRRSGFGSGVQVLGSSFLYGVVHSAWGLTSGVVTWELTGGAVIGTAVFGLFCSGVYLLSRRSLLPIVVAHGLIDFVIEPWLFLVALEMIR
jgi:hypothetical protein